MLSLYITITVKSKELALNHNICIFSYKINKAQIQNSMFQTKIAFFLMTALSMKQVCTNCFSNLHITILNCYSLLAVIFN